MPIAQLTLPFDREIVLLSPDEIYAQATPDLLRRLQEDRRVERKPIGIHARDLGQYFSMWANTAPDGGVMILGLEDNGEISGCKSADVKHLNELERAGDVYCADARYDHKRVPVRNREGNEDFVLLIRIYYRFDKVVRTGSGHAFARRGDSRKRLSEDEIRELSINKQEIDFEQEPVRLTYPEDFDIKIVKQFIDKVRIERRLPPELTDEEILELRHLGRISDGRLIPNNACGLLFAKDPSAKFPGCKIRFLRFDGEHEGTGEKFNAVKDVRLEGPVPTLVAESEKVVESQLREFSRLGSDGRFYTASEYPKAAWYEAIVNACVHRSYSLRNMVIFIKMFDDRLEFESPGSFPPLVTPKNIYDMHQPRNPHLMDAMFYLDFVKCAHEGTRRMRDTMLEMDLPLPKFTQEDIAHSLVRVTLRNNAKQRKIWLDSDASELLGESIFRELDEYEKRAINFIAEHGSINVSQMQRLTGRTWHFGKKVLLGLVSRSILMQIRRTDIDRDPKARFLLRNGVGKDRPVPYRAKFR